MVTIRPLVYFFFISLFCGVLGYPAATSTEKDTKRSDIAIPSHPHLTEIITSRPGFSSELNVNKDRPSSEDTFQRNQKRAEVESEKQDEEEDDSDMYMEPIEIEKIKPKQSTSTNSPSLASQPAASLKDNQEMGQHFFPSFAPSFTLGHSRPHNLFFQEPFFTPKARAASSFETDFNPFRTYRDSPFKIPITLEDEAISTNILGSGNFGVLKGGTYYNEDDGYRGLFTPYYSNNGHGRPYYSNPRPQKYSGGDFFSNFRDFADINTPAKASFSEYVIVYVNKNATNPNSDESSSPRTITKPKNIFEQLTLLDQDEYYDDAEEYENPKKLSLHKRKLALLKEEKLNKQKKSNYYKNKESGKDLLEPLLALS